MKKILVLIILGFILSGCATYKFQKPATSGAVGYLACYDGKPILEYTVGKDKTLPDLILAKERFKRRRPTVEYYYKKTGQIESRLKEYFWDTPKMLVDLLGGILRWPFIAVADYKYNRNPQYKERVDRLDEQKEELEKIRVNALKEKLAIYIAQDLNKEASSSGVVAVAREEAKIKSTLEPVISEVASEAVILAPQEVVSLPLATVPTSVPVIEPTTVPVKLPDTAEPIEKIEPRVQAALEPPVAIIIAKPARGNSPLKVNFSAQKSYSKSGKIIAYDWDFGDGDSSTKKNTENTYWSTTFGSRNFTVTLTVKDQAGAVSSSTTVIEVSTL